MHSWERGGGGCGEGRPSNDGLDRSESVLNRRGCMRGERAGDFRGVAWLGVVHPGGAEGVLSDTTFVRKAAVSARMDSIALFSRRPTAAAASAFLVLSCATTSSFRRRSMSCCSSAVGVINPPAGCQRPSATFDATWVVVASSSSLAAISLSRSIFSRASSSIDSSTPADCAAPKSCATRSACVWQLWASSASKSPLAIDCNTPSISANSLRVYVSSTSRVAANFSNMTSISFKSWRLLAFRRRMHEYSCCSWCGQRDGLPAGIFAVVVGNAAAAETAVMGYRRSPNHNALPYLSAPCISFLISPLDDSESIFCD
eukprot:Opistho-2@68342